MTTTQPTPPTTRAKDHRRARVLSTGLLLVGASTVGVGLPALFPISRDGPPDLPAAPQTFTVFAVAGAATMLVGLALLAPARPSTAQQRRLVLLSPLLGVMWGSVLGMFFRFIPLPAMWFVAGGTYVLGVSLVARASRDRTSVPVPTAGGSRFDALVTWVLDLPRQAKLALAFGAAIVVEIGIALAGFLTEPKPGAATCEGEQMSPGDLCRIYEEPGHVLVDTKTYDEMLADVAAGNTAVGWAAVIALVVTVGAAAVQIIKSHRSR